MEATMMTMARRALLRHRRAAAGWFVLLVLAGCAAVGGGSGADSGPLPLDEAVAAAADRLAVQAQKLPGLASAPAAAERTIVVDPLLDGASGRPTPLARTIQEKVAARLAAGQPPLRLQPFQPASLSRSHYVLTGTATPQPSAAQNGKPATLRIDLALTDLANGKVVAQAAASALNPGAEAGAAPASGGAPTLAAHDKAVEGYILTTRTPPGQPAARDYYERLSSTVTLNEATLAYHEGRLQQALDLYKTAAASPSADTLRALNGIHLASWKLGRTQEAEEAFGRIVATGLANRSLGVKFLFNPGSADFISDPQVSGPYPLWLRQIARQAVQAKACLQVVGHASRRGADGRNSERLAVQRATVVRQRLGTEARELLPRIRAIGVGARENLVGTGADDASDALDRRVEFKVVGC